MKIKLFPFPSSGDSSVKLPRFLLSIGKSYHRGKPVFILGRLYVGYVGILWVTRLFELDLWIANMQKQESES